MSWPITLIIPTHNRPHYLERILDYYTKCPFSILILDSSVIPYQHQVGNNCLYMHLPGETFTQKLAIGFIQVKTPFLVMCADDDFIIPKAIDSCVRFLESNKDYTAASGNIVCYIPHKKDTNLEFVAMYTDRLSLEVANNDPFERLRTFFNPYRSIFYAVHRTASLQNGFSASASIVRNLYLNEYLTAIAPIISGKYKELPVFYQLREYAETSDDKTTINIDAIIGNPKHQKQYDDFIQTQSGIMAELTGKSGSECASVLNMVLTDFASELPKIRNYAENSSVKKIGLLISKMPLFGKKIILLNRARIIKQKLRMIIKTADDKSNLAKVASYIYKYR